jgi:hypothetical protein
VGAGGERLLARGGASGGASATEPGDLLARRRERMGDHRGAPFAFYLRWRSSVTSKSGPADLRRGRLCEPPSRGPRRQTALQQ